MTNAQEFQDRREEEYRQELRGRRFTWEMWCEERGVAMTADDMEDFLREADPWWAARVDAEIEEAVRDSRAEHSTLRVGERDPGLARG